MNDSRDHIYKQLFSHPEIVRDLVAGALPAAWAQALEVEVFERVNASYASEQGKLPPVLPIVFYHGRRPWRAATELADLMLPPPDGLAQFQAQQQYLLIDQHHDGERGNVVTLLLSLLRSRTEAARKTALNAVLARFMLPDLAAVRASLERWLLLTLRDDGGGTNLDWREDFNMNTKRQPRFNDLITEDFVRRLLQPNEEALQEGIQQGMQQGELLALRNLLGDLLVGDVPEQAGQKIADADSSQLRAWIKSLTAGASPRQLFAEG